MIRRLKADVAKGLPPKTETLLMVGMSKIQKQLYKRLLLRDIDAITGKGNTQSGRTAILNIVTQVSCRRGRQVASTSVTVSAAF